jgi:hypothetical protein
LRKREERMKRKKEQCCEVGVIMGLFVFAKCGLYWRSSGGCCWIWAYVIVGSIVGDLVLPVTIPKEPKTDDFLKDFDRLAQIN